MANFLDADVFSRLAGQAGEVTRERTRLYTELFRASGAEALDVGKQLLTLFEQLPTAMIASERAEHERLIAQYGKEHAFVADARGSLAGLERFADQAAAASTRVRRSIDSMTAPGAAFFGFVHDESGKALGGLTIRISSAAKGSTLQAHTAEDGHFHIPLGHEKSAPPVGTGKRAAGRKAERAGESSVKVEILDGRGRVVHTDPIPLVLAPVEPTDTDGVQANHRWAQLSESIYREYRLTLEEGNPRSAKPASGGKRRP